MHEQEPTCVHTSDYTSQGDLKCQVRPTGSSGDVMPFSDAVRMLAYPYTRAYNTCSPGLKLLVDVSKTNLTELSPAREANSSGSTKICCQTPKTQAGVLLTFVCLLLSVLSWDSILLSSSSCLECIFIFSVDISRIVTTSSNSTAASCCQLNTCFV